MHEQIARESNYTNEAIFVSMYRQMNKAHHDK